MRKEKTYNITEWSGWDHTIYLAIINFYEVFEVNPNILLASLETLTQLDYLISYIPEYRQNIVREGLNEPNKLDKDVLSVSSFSSHNLCVEFACEQKMKFKEFTLVYDENPEWEPFECQ